MLVLVLLAIPIVENHAPHPHGSRNVGTGRNSAASSRDLGFFRNVLLNVLYNPHNASVDGHAWPPGAIALSMAGQRRLDNFAALVATAVEDGVQGFSAPAYFDTPWTDHFYHKAYPLDMDSDGDNALGRDGAEEQEREDQGEDINARE